jgi:hypothetical protein
MAFIAFIAYRLLRNYLHCPVIFREKRHRLLVCRPNPRVNNANAEIFCQSPPFMVHGWSMQIS